MVNTNKLQWWNGRKPQKKISSVGITQDSSGLPGISCEDNDCIQVECGNFWIWKRAGLTWSELPCLAWVTTGIIQSNIIQSVEGEWTKCWNSLTNERGGTVNSHSIYHELEGGAIMITCSLYWILVWIKKKQSWKAVCIFHLWIRHLHWAIFLGCLLFWAVAIFWVIFIFGVVFIFEVLLSSSVPFG